MSLIFQCRSAFSNDIICETSLLSKVTLNNYKNLISNQNQNVQMFVFLKTNLDLLLPAVPFLQSPMTEQILLGSNFCMINLMTSGPRERANLSHSVLMLAGSREQNDSKALSISSYRFIDILLLFLKRKLLNNMSCRSFCFMIFFQDMGNAVTGC